MVNRFFGSMLISLVGKLTALFALAVCIFYGIVKIVDAINAHPDDGHGLAWGVVIIIVGLAAYWIIQFAFGLIAMKNFMNEPYARIPGRRSRNTTARVEMRRTGRWPGGL